MRNGNRLELEVADDLGVMQADLLKLRQILLNLLSNASKFTERGTVRLHARKERAPEASEQVLFVVQDTGIGMSSEQLGRLFEDGVHRPCGGYREECMTPRADCALPSSGEDG